MCLPLQSAPPAVENLSHPHLQDPPYKRERYLGEEASLCLSIRQRGRSVVELFALLVGLNNLVFELNRAVKHRAVLRNNHL